MTLEVTPQLVASGDTRGRLQKFVTKILPMDSVITLNTPKYPYWLNNYSDVKPRTTRYDTDIREFIFSSSAERDSPVCQLISSLRSDYNFSRPNLTYVKYQCPNVTETNDKNRQV